MSERRDSGFSLIEVVVSICVIGIVMGALPSAMNSITRNAAQSEVQTVAFFLARHKMEEIVVRKGLPKVLGYNLIVAEGPTAFSSPFGNYSYTVATQLKSYNGTTLSDSGSDVGYKEVAVTVTGQNATAKITQVIGNYGE